MIEIFVGAHWEKTYCAHLGAPMATNAVAFPVLWETTYLLRIINLFCRLSCVGPICTLV